MNREELKVKSGRACSRPELYFAEVFLGSAGYKFVSECGIREGENPVFDPESLPITEHHLRVRLFGIAAQSGW